MKKFMIIMAVSCSVLITGCAPKLDEMDAEIIRQGLTKLNHNGTLYACHTMRHGQDLNLMCRKIVNRKRLTTVPRDAQ